MPGLFNIALKSLKFYRKQAFYQFLIIAILCAVITGSLLTGHSVRSSLKRTAAEHLGNTGILISSGIRYFDRDLAGKLKKSVNSSGFLEIKGSIQSLASQESENNATIFAIDDDFFRFHGNDKQKVNQGEAIINKRLADQLGIKPGDDVAIRFDEISDIPADAPFAPGNEDGMSLVLKAGAIAGPEEAGNFSLTISQITPYNIFLNISDLDAYFGRKFSFNRLVADRSSGLSAGEAEKILAENLEPAHIGLKPRLTNTGHPEVISTRIFLDEPLIEAVSEKIRGSAPVITYLANRIGYAGNSTPYSFVSAIPEEVYPEVPKAGSVIINNWLAEDLGASAGDSLEITWYSPDSLNHLVEKSRIFPVQGIVAMDGAWGDRTLMPEFPGIAGSESCSDWDAGVPINTNQIRQKDEDYWRDYKGTPKAFINYETGREIWGSNFGPATAIRFPSDYPVEEIERTLAGSIDPFIAGFFVSDIWSESLRAADNSVDFGTLFLSLGFFLIFASFVLLSFSVTYYFEMKRRDVSALYSLGFKNKAIRKILFSESAIISAAGCLAGAVTGYFVNAAVISALNSVWRGAVQTNTLVPAFDVTTLLTGFAATFIVILVFMYISTGRMLRMLSEKSKSYYNPPSPGLNLALLAGSFFVALAFFVLSLSKNDNEVMFSFISGAFLFAAMILVWRQYRMKGSKASYSGKGGNRFISGKYYSFFPSHAVTPVLFIAAGVFAVFITIVNRKDFSAGMNERSSGTGGYKLWLETSVPLSEDLNTPAGRRNLGLDEDSLSGLTFIQMKRLPGNDASCLNLNHITSPPLLGADAQDLAAAGAFSFAKRIDGNEGKNAWELLEQDAGRGVVYGIADQTVLDWGLKIGVGDTLALRAESGERLDIVIAASLKTSVFQGYVIISKNNLARYFPSVSGNSVFLAEFTGEPGSYRSLLSERLYSYAPGISTTAERLRAFYEITNTYLSVFGVFGGLGMITGIAGLGFVLLRNYSRRKREFALMISTGFTAAGIRKMIFSEQSGILLAGILSGLIPAIVSTLPSLRSNHEVPWIFLAGVIAAIYITGVMAVIISSRTVKEDNLVDALRKD